MKPIHSKLGTMGNEHPETAVRFINDMLECSGFCFSKGGKDKIDIIFAGMWPSYAHPDPCEAVVLEGAYD